MIGTGLFHRSSWLGTVRWFPTLGITLGGDSSIFKVVVIVMILKVAVVVVVVFVVIIFIDRIPVSGVSERIIIIVVVVISVRLF